MVCPPLVWTHWELYSRPMGLYSFKFPWRAPKNASFVQQNARYGRSGSSKVVDFGSNRNAIWGSHPIVTPLMPTPCKNCMGYRVTSPFEPFWWQLLIFSNTWRMKMLNSASKKGLQCYILHFGDMFWQHDVTVKKQNKVTNYFRKCWGQQVLADLLRRNDTTCETDSQKLLDSQFKRQALSQWH